MYLTHDPEKRIPIGKRLGLAHIIRFTHITVSLADWRRAGRGFTAVKPNSVSGVSYSRGWVMDSPRQRQTAIFPNKRPLLLRRAFLISSVMRTYPGSGGRIRG